MNVRRIRLRNLYGHADSAVDLPERGIVVVSGDNGSGKSGFFLEGVPVATWGKTLRGAPPWGAVESVAEVEVAGVAITRVRTKNRTKLLWRVVDDGTVEGTATDAVARLGVIPQEGDDFESATKAQEGLDKVVGSFDVWRRTAAFSSSDAAHFSLATDAERKRLLESIVGVDRFDPALAECRRDLADAERRAVEAEAKVRVAEAKVEAEEAALSRAKADLAAFADEAPPPVEVATGAPLVELERLLVACEADLAKVRRTLRTAEMAAATASSDLRRAEGTLRRLLGLDVCPTCEQKVPPEHVARLRSTVDEAVAKSTADLARAKEDQGAAQGDVDEFEEESRALRRRVGDAQNDARRVEERARERDRWAATRKRVVAAVDDAKTRLGKASAEADSAREATGGLRVEVSTLTAVEAVLGLRGVRAHLLGRALGGIEAIANGWLARLGLVGLGLRLRPYTEKKTGGVADAISVEIAGAGGGNGYRAASGGERRRIDLAILLSLAEVSSAARGVKVGTLFFDELFDALDGDGVSAVTVVLSELARERAVVVVTHNGDLARALPAVRRYRVADGTIS